MRKVHWQYLHASMASMGVMLCQRCGEMITEGQYRSRDNRKHTGFVNEHKSCSLDDPAWGEMDRKSEERRVLLLRYRDDLSSLRNKWKGRGVFCELEGPLDDEIEWLDSLTAPGQ